MDLAEIEARDVAIDALEASIKAELPAVDCPITNHFAPGLYAREMFIPAGTVLTGKIHKYANLSIMSKGALRLRLEDGSTQDVRAPFTYVAPPGTRRAAFALEDTVWTVIHATEETDVEKIEQAVVCQTPEEYRLFFQEQLKLEGSKL